MSSLSKRIAYLGIADFDYLAARLLLLDGLAFAALPKAAEALLLEAKISRNEELTPRQLKAFGDDLPSLFAALKATVPAAFDSSWAHLAEGEWSGGGEARVRTCAPCVLRRARGRVGEGGEDEWRGDADAGQESDATHANLLWA